MQQITRRDILSILGVEFSDFVFLPSMGASGGFLVAWKRNVGHTGLTRIDDHCVSVQFCKNDGTSWWLTCVYGPQSDADKILFLQEIKEIRVACAGPWVIAGDFNLIYNASDKNNTNLNMAMMSRFRSAINDLALKEIQLHAGNILGQISMLILCWSSWTEFFALLIGRLFSQMCCFKVLLLRLLTTAPYSWGSMIIHLGKTVPL
jgi:hypothetical protein